MSLELSAALVSNPTRQLFTCWERMNMIRSIRNFFCHADPIGLTVMLGVVLLIGMELFLLGIVPFLLILGFGLVVAALVVAIGWLLYKFISLLQRLCK